MAGYTKIATALKIEAGVTKHTVQAWGWKAYHTNIIAPQGRTLAALYVVAHECGHVALGHVLPGCSKPGHVMEYEAEVYAAKAFRRHGLEVPHSCEVEARGYVRDRLQEDRKKGLKISRTVLAWVR